MQICGLKILKKKLNFPKSNLVMLLFVLFLDVVKFVLLEFILFDFLILGGCQYRKLRNNPSGLVSNPSRRILFLWYYLWCLAW